MKDARWLLYLLKTNSHKNWNVYSLRIIYYLEMINFMKHWNFNESGYSRTRFVIYVLWILYWATLLF